MMTDGVVSAAIHHRSLFLHEQGKRPDLEECFAFFVFERHHMNTVDIMLIDIEIRREIGLGFWRGHQVLITTDDRTATSRLADLDAEREVSEQTSRPRTELLVELASLLRAETVQEEADRMSFPELEELTGQTRPQISVMLPEARCQRTDRRQASNQ